MKGIWIVSEGSPGHISQSVGLTEELARLIPVQTAVIEGREKTRGWLRPLMRNIISTTAQKQTVQTALLRHAATVNVPATAPAPDLIISSGGKSVFAAKTLSLKYKIPYVFIGERKPFPAKWFHTVISPVPAESAPNSIDVEIIPTQVKLAPPFFKTNDQGPRLWTMIIGGASRSHGFSDGDWCRIAEGMNHLAKQQGICWLLTTSRRTGDRIEKQLKTLIDPAVVADAIWWAEHPRRELQSFMARAEMHFVTQDSVTMISEAISTRKPVVAILPDNLKFPKSSFLPAYFKRLEDNQRLVRVSAQKLPQVEIDTLKFSPLMVDILRPVAEKLIARLSWK